MDLKVALVKMTLLALENIETHESHDYSDSYIISNQNISDTLIEGAKIAVRTVSWDMNYRHIVKVIRSVYNLYAEMLGPDEDGDPHWMQSSYEMAYGDKYCESHLRRDLWEVRAILSRCFDCDDCDPDFHISTFKAIETTEQAKKRFADAEKNKAIAEKQAKIAKLQAEIDSL